MKSKKTIGVTKTDRRCYSDPCPACQGTGRVDSRHLPGWYVTFHYQDGSETGGPYSYEDAVAYVTRHDPTCHTTLVGPDGYVYVVSGEPGG